MATLDHTPGPWSYYISENCESEFEIYGDCCPIGTVERWNGDDNDELMGQPAATGSATTVVIDVYPIIDGQPWDIPCDFLIIEEADIMEIENAREDDQ